MQLESSVFGVCVIQLRPQLEALLGLPRGALTKEIRLTQDLLSLFIEYQIPSDLLTFDGEEARFEPEPEPEREERAAPAESLSGSQPPFVQDWEEEYNFTCGRKYYVNHSTKSTQWVRPIAMESEPEPKLPPSGTPAVRTVKVHVAAVRAMLCEAKEAELREAEEQLRAALGPPPPYAPAVKPPWYPYTPPFDSKYVPISRSFCLAS